MNNNTERESNALEVYREEDEKLLMGISYLTNTSIPTRQSVTYEEIKEHVVKKGGLFRGPSATEKMLGYKDNKDKQYYMNSLGIKNSDIINETERRRNYSGAGMDYLYIKNPNSQYFISHTMTYIKEITPRDVNRYKKFKKILTDGKENQALSNMRTAIKKHLINRSPNNDAYLNFKIQVNEDVDEYINVAVKAFCFSTYYLSPAVDNDHRCAILSMVASDALDCLGDKIMIETVHFSNYHSDGFVQFKNKEKSKAKKVEKESIYKEW